MKYLIPLLLLFAGLVSPAFAHDSSYTSLVDCPQQDGPVRSDDHQDWGLFECPGYGGYRLFAVYGDAREWVRIGRGDWELDLYAEIMKNTPCCFSNLGAKVAEWRHDESGRATALIFRINSSGGAQEESLLFVYRLGETAEETCLLGTARSNQRAREIADQATGCPAPTVTPPVTPPSR